MNRAHDYVSKLWYPKGLSDDGVCVLGCEVRDHHGGLIGYFDRQKEYQVLWMPVLVLLSAGAVGE
jgi:hypothetical protein